MGITPLRPKLALAPNTQQTPAEIETRPMRLSEESAMDVGDAWAVIWRGRLRVFACVVIMAAAAWAYIQKITTPIYQATATVVLETRSTQVIDMEGVISGLSGESVDIATQVQVLRARSLHARVVDELDLSAHPVFIRPPRSYELLAQISALFPSGLFASPYDLLGPDRRDGTIDALSEMISIRNIPNSLVFEIKVETTNPTLSAQIANAMADRYVTDQLLVKSEATEQATNWLSERVIALEAELEEAETNLTAFTTEIDLISADDLLEMQRQAKEQRLRITHAEEEITRLQGLEGQGSSEDRRRNLEALSRTERLLANLNDARIDLDARIEAQSQDLIRLEQLERETEATRLQYSHFLNRFKETSVQQGIQRADSRILSSAFVPTDPSSPRKALILAMGISIGLLVGIAWVLLREGRQVGFRSGLQLELATGLAVMGQIPRTKRNSRKFMTKTLASKRTTSFSEAVRNLRTSILATNFKAPPQVIMLSSSVPSEGKTTQSIALAHQLGALGNSVLLIEGDVRRRVFQHYFPLHGKQGLLSAISDDSGLETLVHTDQRLGIDVLAGEASEINAADLFESAQFARFMRIICDQYDHIVIDTPPVLAVPDARVIGRYADAILYVVRWDYTNAHQVSEGLSQFETSGLRVSGLILSQIDPKGMKRYGYSSYYGSAGSSYYTASA